MITSQQCKAARMLLDWSAKDLADQAQLPPSLISRFEKQDNVTLESLNKIISTFSSSNIKFTEDGGVVVLKDTSLILEGDDCVPRLWELILDSFESAEGGEVLITNVDEKRALEKSNANLKEHIQNLEKKNIKERLLSCEGDTFFLADPNWYRWLDKDFFRLERSTYIFNGCVAYQSWDSSVILYIRNQSAYDAEKRRFEELWSRAKKPKLDIED